MPAVFVHGNPETEAVWGPLLAELGRDDTICLSPPGFGAPVPDGFGATRQEYVDWLTAELERIDGPIDLVGHDWGGGHVLGVVTSRPELVRSWATDVMGIGHPDYVWHDFAQIWRTPGEGEESLKQMLGGPIEDRVAMFQGFGVSAEVASEMAQATDEEMARCILALYRSAPEEDLHAFGEAFPKAQERPGLAIIASEDPFVGDESQIREMAERAGAKVTVLDGVGHWWMTQDPKKGAEVLTSFWGAL